MWWIIIGAVIALVVLIVLLVLFTGKTGGLERGLTECEGKGGICTTSDVKECPGSTLSSTSFDCKEPNTDCCIGVPKDCSANSQICRGGSESCIGPYKNGKHYCK